MTRAIESLMNEHRIIEKVLASLKTFVDGLQPGTSGTRQRVAEYAEFFREFADRCHHGKEEDRLFVAMADYGFPRESGPVFVMLREHDLGRAHVRALAEVGRGDGELSEHEIAAVRSHAEEFIPLLANHIRKEDGILYPAAQQAMPGPVLDALAEQFDEFERSVMGERAHQRLHATAAGLIEAFAPDVSALGGVGGGSPCAG